MVKKKLIITLSVVAIVVIALAVGYFSIVGSKTVAAQLHVESGGVLVNEKEVSRTVLKEDDAIKTLDNGYATIILYESVIINLDPNTEVVIDDLINSHPKIEQKSGKTWNTFTKLLGIEDYSAKAGNSVASVRGTLFALKENYILVGDSEVDFGINSLDFIVEENKVVEEINGEIIERDATTEELQEIKQNINRVVAELKYLREKEIEKKKLMLKIVKIEIVDSEGVKRTLNQEEAREYLEDADNKEVDIDSLLEKSPIEIESLEKIVSITKEIQKLVDLGKRY